MKLDALGLFEGLGCTSNTATALLAAVALVQRTIITKSTLMLITAAGFCSSVDEVYFIVLVLENDEYGDVDDDLMLLVLLWLLLMILKVYMTIVMIRFASHVCVETSYM